MFNFGIVNKPTKLEPLVKWSGSKRRQAPLILEHFPKEIETYYEPFVGGASMIGALLCSDIKVKRYVCSDKNESLIGIYTIVKNDPDEISNYYERLWEEMKSLDTWEEKKGYYNSVRDRYNREHDPKDFFFITRTVFNGMPRYNSNGEFNNPLHVNRDGILPIKMKKIINDWSVLFNRYNVEFLCRDFSEVNPHGGDLVYCDPPYEESGAMYFGSFDTPGFYDWLRGLNCKCIISYDGYRNGEGKSNVEIPKDIWDKHLYLESGNSSFSRLANKSAIVYESLYIRG